MLGWVSELVGGSGGWVRGRVARAEGDRWCREDGLVGWSGDGVGGVG